MGAVEVLAERVCEGPGCGVKIKVTAKRKGRPRIYHDEDCRIKAQILRERRKRNDAKRRAGHNRPAEYNADGRPGSRRGPAYEAFCELNLFERLHVGNLTQKEAAQIARESGDPRLAKCSQPQVARFVAAWREDIKAEAVARDWEPDPDALELLEDFGDFRAAAFRTVILDSALEDVEPQPYLTPPFHKRWVESIQNTMRKAGRLLILSPPRHGKSELLIHFCIYLICKNPNICIMWVGKNEDIAKQSVGMVREELESNEWLQLHFGGPNNNFVPAKSSARPWGDDKLTVATRTTGRKSPTLRAIGRGSSTLSRDADLIVLDDIIDDKSVQTVESRAKDSQWVRTQISSRKMKHTAIVAIGSRQHPEDLWNDLSLNAAWDSIIEAAHDPKCHLPLTDFEAHTNCVLFPEINPFEHLMAQREEFGPDLFQMVYQNDPTGVGVRVFNVPLLEGCKNDARAIGDTTYRIDSNTSIGQLPLIAGIDPASAGIQACVLWAIHPPSKTRFLLDLEADQAGGIDGFLRVMQMWYERYLCDEWVLETNAHQGMWHSDEVRNYARHNGIRVHEEHTGAEKADKYLGPTFHATLMAQESPLLGATRRIDLPWAPDAETRRKTNMLVREYLGFDGELKQRWSRSDVLMAGWIPEKHIRALIKRLTSSAAEQRKRNRVHYTYMTTPYSRTA